MSTAATHVTSQEGALSTPSSENGSAPESDTSLVDSESHSQDKLLLAPEVTFTPLPLESSLLSELPGSTPHPESISQLKQKVEEWTQDPDSTQLVLKSISTGTFNLLRPDLMNHTSSFPCKLIKALYISRLQQVELRKLSLLHWTASHHLVSLIFQQIGDLSWEMGDKTGQGENWTDSLTLDVATAHVCPDGEPTDGKTADPFAYMSATCCVWPMSLYLHKGSSGIYDDVLPTIVVVAGVDTFDEEISEEVKRWLKPRNGLSTEVNGVIYISLKVESDSLFSIQLSLFISLAHFKFNIDQPSIPSDPSYYHLYSQVQWTQEWGVTPEIPGSFTIPPSVVWGIGNCPKGFPKDAKITLTAKDLERFSSAELRDYRRTVSKESEFAKLKE